MAPKQSPSSRLVVTILSIVLVVPCAAWTGFVASTLWGWFVVPLGVVHIGTWGAAGIYLVARLLTSNPQFVPEGTSVEILARGLAYTAITPTFALMFGALYHGLAT